MFSKSLRGAAGWMETPQPAESESKWNQKIYAIDCEMVRDAFVCLLLAIHLTYFFIKVYHRGWKRVDASVCDWLYLWHRRIRPTRKTDQTNP